ncbi:hypothetical protein E2C01_007028 [Portunus trituberculatus]|uniref:Uncharacterized protein n=1 Tax=Portunus trituberculatus TaxID=210409 RepID=A0A5B7CYX6_PORTR|nr:hypothetical protein [Portunus trituberculatus]
MPKIFLIKDRLQQQQAKLLEAQKAGVTLDDDRGRHADLNTSPFTSTPSTLDLRSSSSSPRETLMDTSPSTIDLRKDKSAVPEKSERLDLARLDLSRDSLNLSRESHPELSRDSRLSLSRESRLNLTRDSRLDLSVDSRLNLSRDNHLNRSLSSRLSLPRDSRLDLSRDSRLEVTREDPLDPESLDLRLCERSLDRASSPSRRPPRYSPPRLLDDHSPDQPLSLTIRDRGKPFRCVFLSRHVLFPSASRRTFCMGCI